ncbi:MAG: DNA topoisomerase VI subunit B [Planctomycetota bacterium]
MAKKRQSSSKPRVTAEVLAAKQREISVSEFFAKNRHLLGFDNPRKATLTAVKEAVDNALDACEEAGILPDILVELQQLDSKGKPIKQFASAKPTEQGEEGKKKSKDGKKGEAGGDRFKVIVQDNGPGIVRRQIENIFGKLLYGSKFHRLKMSRGQQGIGISAAGMYGLITTGKPVKIISKTSKRKPAHEVILKMDTSKNKADVVSETEHPEDDHFFPEGHGTRIEIEMKGAYFTGKRSVDEYVQLSAIANPHASFAYITPPTSAEPEGTKVVYTRAVEELPELPEEIKPHPHGIELGTLISMIERTEHRQLGGFFGKEFCRIGPKIAKEITEAAKLTPNSWVKTVDHHAAEQMYEAMQSAKVMAPPTNCLSPIGVKTLLKGLEQGLEPEFIAASSRPPSVYRGRPFLIEAGIAFGGDLPGDESAQVFRFANRVPLQYQQSACSSFKAVTETAWKNYSLQQPRGALPVGPLVIMIHMASVWVPFTSESKEAIADYDEIRKEMKLALQECGRKLGIYMRRRQRMKKAGERRGVFLRYIGEISKAAHHITGADQEKLYTQLMDVAQRKTEEFDQELDEEGRVVGKRDSLAKDDGVMIRTVEERNENAEPLQAEISSGADLDLEAIAEAKESSSSSETATLFADQDPPVQRGKKKKKRVIKKVRKKRT